MVLCEADRAAKAATQAPHKHGIMCGETEAAHSWSLESPGVFVQCQDESGSRDDEESLLAKGLGRVGCSPVTRHGLCEADRAAKAATQAPHKHGIMCGEIEAAHSWSLESPGSGDDDESLLAKGLGRAVFSLGLMPSSAGAAP